MTTILSWDGGLTLLAPLVAVGLALLTRRVVPSLGAAIVVGAVVAARGSIPTALAHIAEVIFEVTTSTDNLKVSAFSVLVAATVGVMGASGGTAAMVARVEGLARGRRGAMAASWLAGGVVFFDDYANCLVVGGAMGPLCDRNRVSRAKLAYIVDATAAPIASLAILSTWVGYEVSLLGEALAGTGSSAAGFSVFLTALPYRFYCVLTLAFVGAIALSGRDFGPMYAAEARQRASTSGVSTSDVSGTQASIAPTSAWLAVVPILALVGITFGGLWRSGWRALGPDAVDPRLFEVLGAADAFQSMLDGSLAALIVAGVLAVASGSLRVGEVPRAAWSSIRTVAAALVVLYLAWTLGGIIKDTEAAGFIASGLQGWLPPALLPALVFLLAVVTSFSTGSSFFTMGALIPLVIPLAVELGQGSTSPILLASAAAVLDGAVLGDHASPISDTTILSSLGSRCDVVTHVRTQLPYVLVVGLVALLMGTIPAGLGWSPWLGLGLGSLACVGLVLSLGRVPPTDDRATDDRATDDRATDDRASPSSDPEPPLRSGALEL
ncbi:MAG TPA: Na+/H+ antiporter NhaC family protein [Deltaproteobacteria bacterium]|nr:Na+/H+ antiporter NhaC family protein [Deltaproteobacteria bacterium]